MKVAPKLRSRYADLYPLNRLTANEAEKRIRPLLDSRWHFEWRLKTEESYALKIESGAFLDDCCIEDFFACTIVVRHLSEIDDAEHKVNDAFEIVERRPSNTIFTSKRPLEFNFDDLRMYCRIRAHSFEDKKPIHDVIFEVQVKTFLQHAWAIATHDLIYKSDQVSWPRQRIAFQVKAMLEHAEISIIEADTLSRCTHIAKKDKTTNRLSEIIDLTISQWPREKLPGDLVRLSQTIDKFLTACCISVKKLQQALLEATENGQGVNTEDLSPYAVVVETISLKYPDAIRRMCGRDDLRSTIVIPAGVTYSGEIALPQNPKIKDLREPSTFSATQRQMEPL